jgi:hypothetical protein
MIPEESVKQYLSKKQWEMAEKAVSASKYEIKFTEVAQLLEPETLEEYFLDAQKRNKNDFLYHEYLFVLVKRFGNLEKGEILFNKMIDKVQA